MIGRRATVGLALLCALLFSAIAVQSAAGASATKTTAFTCVKGGGNLDFKDAHCDEKVSPGTGEYGHVSLSVGNTTDVTAASEESSVIKGEPFKVKTEITCSTWHASGVIGNTEPIIGIHIISFDISIRWTTCTVQKPAKCTIKEFEAKLEGEGVEELGAGKNEMGIQFKPKGGGTTLTTITLEGSECSLKGKPFKLEGTVISTGVPAPTGEHAGAHLVFTNAMTKETLKAAEKPAELSAKGTLKMVDGNPISLTTVTD